MIRARSCLSTVAFVLVLAASVGAAAVACSDSDSPKPGQTGVDASLDTGSNPGKPDGGGTDAPSGTDAATTDAATDATKTDGSDGATDGGMTYSCGAFTENPGWTVASGFRAVVVAKDNGLTQPVAITFAGGAYGGLLYVVNQGDNVLRRVNTNTGAVASFTAGAQWGTRPPQLLTSITWDEENVFDGQLYVGDQGGDNDQDSAIYRVGSNGAASTFVTAPGPGLDDIFGLAFAPKGGAYPQGLYVTGDTDGTLVDFGVFTNAGTDAGLAFSEVAGSEGISFVRLPSFGGVLLASRPNGGGYAGADEVSRINADGGLGAALATGIAGVHAVTYATGGAFGSNVYVASWSSGKIFRIDSTGTKTEVASGLTLTNYDGNVLAISPDGNTMMVADRGANRIVCIEKL